MDVPNPPPLPQKAQLPGTKPPGKFTSATFLAKGYGEKGESNLAAAMLAAGKRVDDGTTSANTDVAKLRKDNKLRDFIAIWGDGELQNPSHEWLKYESVFNDLQYLHTSQRLHFASYSFPLDQLRVLLLHDLPATTLTRLKDAFFPTLTVDEMQECGMPPWIRGPTTTMGDNFTQGAAIKKKHVAHMPYNAVSNNTRAKALGTRAFSMPEATVRSLDGEWPMWQTASRSCVIELVSSASWKPSSRAVVAGTGPNEGVGVILWDYEATRDYNPVPPAAAPSMRGIKAVPDMLDSQGAPVCFSVKTGVVYVGSVNQADLDESGKSTLEDTSYIAAFISDYVFAVERLMVDKTSPAADEARRIIVLPEILTVTCPDRKLNFVTAAKPFPADGFQLRDLSRLDRTKKYFPALSVPYVNCGPDAAHPVNFDRRCDYFAALTATDRDKDEQMRLAKLDPDAFGKELVDYLKSGQSPAVTWSAHWSEEFAGRIGQAKALLHLVYGMQALTPNAQNWVLECGPDMSSSTRVVVRDILDMKLHSDWLLTVLCGQTEVKEPSEARFAFGKLTKDPAAANVVSLLTWAGQQGVISLTETRASRISTELNYFRYTAFHKGSIVGGEGSALGTTSEARPPNWRWILVTNAVWGLSHACNYADVVNTALVLSIDYSRFRTIPLNLAGADMETVKKYTFLDDKGQLKSLIADPTAIFDFYRNVGSILLLTDDKAGYDRASQLHDLFVQWERVVSATIHSAIYGTEDGRKKLRKFHGFA